MQCACSTHTHTRAGAGISMIKDAIRPISQDALHVLDDITYHPYGVPASKEEGEELAYSVAHHNCIILMNHGLLTVTPSIHNGIYLHYRLERACDMEMIARMMGEPPVPVDDVVVKKAAVYMRKFRDDPEYGRVEFDALVRVIERQGARYRC